MTTLAALVLCVGVQAVTASLVIDSLGVNALAGMTSPSSWTGGDPVRRMQQIAISSLSIPTGFAPGSVTTAFYGFGSAPSCGNCTSCCTGTCTATCGSDTSPMRASTTLSSCVLQLSAALLEAGSVTATLSAWLGGRAGKTDAATVSCRFRASDGTRLFSMQIGPLKTAERNGGTKFLFVSRSYIVPNVTATIEVEISQSKASESTASDAYVAGLNLNVTPTVPFAIDQVVAFNTSVLYDGDADESSETAGPSWPASNGFGLQRWRYGTVAFPPGRVPRRRGGFFYRRARGPGDSSTTVAERWGTLLPASPALTDGSVVPDQ